MRMQHRQPYLTHALLARLAAAGACSLSLPPHLNALNSMRTRLP